MTFNELMKKVLDVLPDATLDEDNYGQIIIYTNLKIMEGDNKDETLREMTDADFDDIDDTDNMSDE